MIYFYILHTYKIRFSFVLLLKIDSIKKIQTLNKSIRVWIRSQLFPSFPLLLVLSASFLFSLVLLLLFFTMVRSSSNKTVHLRMISFVGDFSINLVHFFFIIVIYLIFSFSLCFFLMLLQLCFFFLTLSFLDISKTNISCSSQTLSFSYLQLYDQ